MIFKVLINLIVYENFQAFVACLLHALAKELITASNCELSTWIELEQRARVRGPYISVLNITLQDTFHWILILALTCYYLHFKDERR